LRQNYGYPNWRSGLLVAIIVRGLSLAEVGDNGQMRIAGVGIVPSKGMHKGMVSNIDEAKETIRASVNKHKHWKTI